MSSVIKTFKNLQLNVQGLNIKISNKITLDVCRAKSYFEKNVLTTVYTTLMTQLSQCETSHVCVLN